MSRASVPPAPITVRRLLLWTTILFPFVLLVLILCFWLESRIPDWYLLASGAGFPSDGGGGLCRFSDGCGWRHVDHWLSCLSEESGINGGGPFSLVRSCFASRSCWRHSRPRRPAESGNIGCIGQSAMPFGGLGRDMGRAPESRFRAIVKDMTLPTAFPDPPSDRDIDLVVMGESSAEGVPFSNWLSMGSILTWKLSQVIPGRPIRPRVIARSGDTLEWQHRELANLPRRPELLIIYCGHNEFTSRLAESRDLAYYFDESLPTGWDMLVDRIERSSSVCGLIRETAEKCRIAIPPPKSGHRKLVDVPLYSSTEYITLLTDFRRRLDAIVSYAEQIGALPVLIVPAANDAGFEPSRSFLPAATTRSERESFQREFMAVRRLETEGQSPDAAIDCYRSLLARYPGFAETHYRLARMLEQKEAWDEAYRHYVAARDRDGYPMRCTSDFQQVYRDIASRHDCILIDTQSYFHAIGRHGLLDDELFQDAMHPSLRGQIALAQAVLQALQCPASFWLGEGNADPGHRYGGMRRSLRPRDRRLASHLLVGHQFQWPGCPLDLRPEPPPSGTPRLCGGRESNRRRRCTRIGRLQKHRNPGVCARNLAHSGQPGPERLPAPASSDGQDAEPDR